MKKTWVQSGQKIGLWRQGVGNLGNSCSRDHFYSTRWVQHVATFHILFRPHHVLKELPRWCWGNRLRMQPQLRFIQRQDPAFITGTQGSFPEAPKTQLWCSDPGALCCSVEELNSQSLPWNWTHTVLQSCWQRPHRSLGHSWPHWLQIHSPPFPIWLGHTGWFCRLFPES